MIASMAWDLTCCVMLLCIVREKEYVGGKKLWFVKIPAPGFSRKQLLYSGVRPEARTEMLGNE